MVCELGVDTRFVWGGGKCVLGEGGSEMTMYAIFAALGIMFIGAVVFITRSKKTDTHGSVESRISREGMEAFYEKFTVKYKILVTFSQIISKIGTLYPVQLPTLFTSFLGNLIFLSFDIAILPTNCLLDTNFHDRLVATTTSPILFVVAIFFSWLVLRQRLIWKKGDDLSSVLSTLAAKSIRMCVIFLFTVFPMVSTTIFQVHHHQHSK